MHHVPENGGEGETRAHQSWCLRTRTRTRSSSINEELDVVVYDAGFGQQMETMFQEDLKHCREYTLENFNGRSIWERVTEWLAVPFRSQL